MRVAVEAMGRGGEPGFITVSVYGRPGEAAAEHLDKGWLVAVDGRLVFGEWETSTGEKRREHAVIGNVEFLAAPRPTPADAGGAGGALAPPRACRGLSSSTRAAAAAPGFAPGARRARPTATERTT